MSDDEDETRELSDNEVNPKAHKKLLAAVSRIGKTQFIKKPTRSEPALAQDEFHLVKGASESTRKAPQSTVLVNDLVKVLNKTSKHLIAGKELRNARRKKVLPKPLEKPVAERIRRTIGYERLKKDLSKWDAVVTKNRVAEQQVFPLQYEEIVVEMKENEKPPEVKVKGPLRRAIEAVQAEFRAAEEEKPEEKRISEMLSREKLIERRKELTYLKMRESQKSAKARYQNKIKSKKYHRLLKRQKLKEQIKEFELLQAENPELALDKLEKLERSRVLERANLRHKNTGTWAKNLQVRAKYDRDVRKDLAEQLAISKQLTSKLKEDDEYASDNELETQQDKAQEDRDPFNVWSKQSEVDEFASNYRKYWLERNEAESEKLKYKSTETPVDTAKDNALQDCCAEQLPTEGQCDKVPRKVKKTKATKRPKVELDSGWVVEVCDARAGPLLASRKGSVKTKHIDDIFDEAEDVLKEKVTKKIQRLVRDIPADGGGRGRKGARSEQGKRDYLDMSFKQQSSRPELDEELLETPANAAPEDEQGTKLKMPAVSAAPLHQNEPDKQAEYIDPSNVGAIKAKTFHTDLTEAVSTGDFLDECNEDDAAVGEQLTLAQVYEDDDFDADFEKEREDERKKGATEEIDLQLPGWGSWAGCGVSNQRRNKRFVLKFPKQEKRRDENKQKVYINENDSRKLKQHLVSDLPFPFTSVKDYEASIRAPIGPDFVPETAFRMLSRPAVITKMGHIIEPMDKNSLVKIK